MKYSSNNRQNSDKASDKAIGGRHQSPLFAIQSDQLPYPYQQRKVNFSSYSGMKGTATDDANGFRTRSAPMSSHNLHKTTENNQDDNIFSKYDVRGNNTKRIASASAVHNISYQRNGLSTDGEELYIVEQRESKLNSDDGFSMLSMPKLQVQIPEPVDNGELAWILKTNQSLADPAQADLNGSKPVSSFDTKIVESVDRNTHTLCTTTSDSPSRAQIRQEFHAQQSRPPGSPKPAKLKGVTLLSFQGQSTVSPYLDHLTTSNAQLGNAVLSISRLNPHKQQSRALTSTGKSFPKGFSIILNDSEAGIIRPITADNVREVKKSRRILKSATTHRDVVLSNSMPFIPAQPGALRHPTALERVAAFKTQRPDSSVDLETRALRTQQNTWATGASRTNGRIAKDVLTAHSFNKLTNNGRAMSPSAAGGESQEESSSFQSIDQLVSQQRFPDSPVQLVSSLRDAKSGIFASPETIKGSGSVEQRNTYNNSTSLLDKLTVSSPLLTSSELRLSSSIGECGVLQVIHKDPLYCILREENENVRKGLNSSLTALTATDRPSSGLNSDLRPSVIGGISSNELKLLRSFISLPPAVWITSRIVYFLIAAYGHCVVFGREDLQESRNILEFWKTVEKHQDEDNLRLETVEHLYSWPYLQVLLTRPSIFVKVLKRIERGDSHFFAEYPVEKLHHLRELIRHGQGLFQESTLITIVPVCAKLCTWARYVIANIYSSCLERVRIDEQNMNAMTVSGDGRPLSPSPNQRSSMSADDGVCSPSSPVHKLQLGNKIIAVLPDHHTENNGSDEPHELPVVFTTAMCLAQANTKVDFVVVKESESPDSNPVISSSTRERYETSLRGCTASPLVAVIELSHIGKDDPSDSQSNSIHRHPVLAYCQQSNLQGTDLVVVDRTFCQTTGLISQNMDANSIHQSTTRERIESGELTCMFSVALVAANITITDNNQGLHSDGFDSAQHFVVCATESASSWAAFLQARRLAKPADTISVVHIPWLSMCDTVTEANSMTCSRSRYDTQRQLAEERIIRLVEQYRAVDVNLYVDVVPDFIDTMQRFSKYYFDRKTIERKLGNNFSGGPHNSNASIIADCFVFNEEQCFLANRIATVVRQFQPTFVVLGADPVDVTLSLSTAHQTPLNSAFPAADRSSKSVSTNPLLNMGEQQTYRDNDLFDRINNAEFLAVGGDDADSLGFIYNDTTALSITGDSYDAYPLPFANKQNGVIPTVLDSGRGMYEGDENEEDLCYEDDSFIAADDPGDGDDPLYAAESFEDMPSTAVIAAGVPHSPGELSYSASIMPDMSSPFQRYSGGSTMHTADNKEKSSTNVVGLGNMTVSDLQKALEELRLVHPQPRVELPTEESTRTLQQLNEHFQSYKARPARLSEMLLHVTTDSSIILANRSTVFI